MAAAAATAADAAAAATPAALVEEKGLAQKQGEKDRQILSLSSCSTLCSMQGGPFNSITTSGALTPAEVGASASEAPLAEEPEITVFFRLPIEESTIKAATRYALSRNTSERVLHEQALPVRRKHAPTAATAAPKCPTAPAAARSAGSPAVGTRARPQTSLPATVASQQLQQSGLRPGPGSPSIRRPAAGTGAAPSPPSRPARLTVHSGGANPHAASTIPTTATQTPAAAANLQAPPSTAVDTHSASSTATTRVTAALRAAAKPPAKAAALAPLKPKSVAAKPAPPKTAVATTSTRLQASAALMRPAASVAPRSPAAVEASALPTASSSSKGTTLLLPTRRAPLSHLPQAALNGSPAAHAKPSGTVAVAGSLRPKRGSVPVGGVAIATVNACTAASKETAVAPNRPSTATAPKPRPQAVATSPLGKHLPATAKPAGTSASKNSCGEAQKGNTAKGASHTHITAAGPLGSRLVTRLSSLFKRSGSKDVKD